MREDFDSLIRLYPNDPRTRKVVFDFLGMKRPEIKSIVQEAVNSFDPRMGKSIGHGDQAH